MGSDSTPGRSSHSYPSPPTYTLVKAQARVLESGVSGVQRTLGFWPTDVSEGGDGSPLEQPLSFLLVSLPVSQGFIEIPLRPTVVCKRQAYELPLRFECC